MNKIVWKVIFSCIKRATLTREQRMELLNYFNSEIKAFPLEDLIIVTPNGIRLGNGQSMSLEQREAFLQSAKALASNSAFKAIGDQILHAAIRKGLHEATTIDDTLFSKSAVHFIKQFKEWVEALDKVA